MHNYFQFLLSIVKTLKVKNSFIQDFSIVFGGKSLIFMIGFFFMPIIARVFSSEAYGTYALYHSIVMNIAIALSMKISTAFIIVSSERKFRLMLSSLLAFVLLNVLLLSIIFYFFDTWIFSKVENKKLVGSWYLISGGVLLHNLTDIFGHWNVRDKTFKRSTIVSVSESMGTKIGSLSIGLLTMGSNIGLILGEFIGKLLHIFIQLPLFVKNRLYYLRPSFSFKQFRWMLRRFKEYPLLLLPSKWINQFSDSLIIIYLSANYSLHYLGSYSMAIGLTTIPIMIISYSSVPVLMQKVVQLNQNKLPYKKQISRFSATLLLISLPILVVGMLLGQPMIGIFLGEGWEKSALIVSWMIPMIGIQFLYASIDSVLSALKRNKALLTLSLIKLISGLLVLVVASYASTNFMDFIKIMIIGNLISILAITVFSFNKAQIPFDRKLITLLLIYLTSVVCCYYGNGFITF